MASDDPNDTAPEAAAEAATRKAAAARAADAADDFLEEQPDVLFQARMRATNLALGYWRQALAVGVVILLGVGGYGLWRDQMLDEQRTAHANVARVLAKVPREPGPDTDWSVYAAEIAAAGAATQGPARAWADCQAALIYEEADDEAKSLAAWEAANAAGAKGVLGWAAASGYANALGNQQRVDEAAALYRQWATAEPGVIGEQALFALGNLFRDARRMDESAQVFQEFAQRYPESPLVPQVQQALQELQGNG